jgi:hypothetical protein
MRHASDRSQSCCLAALALLAVLGCGRAVPSEDSPTPAKSPAQTPPPAESRAQAPLATEQTPSNSSTADVAADETQTFESRASVDIDKWAIVDFRGGLIAENEDHVLRWPNPAGAQGGGRVDLAISSGDRVIVKRTFSIDVEPAAIPETQSPYHEGEVDLDAKIEDIAVGGGGRFFVLLLAQSKKVAVVDVVQGAVMTEIPLENTDIRITAGRDAWFMAHLATGRLERWKFASQKHELDVQLPEPSIHGIHMGSNSGGPLMVVLDRSKRFAARFFDPDTLLAKPITTVPTRSWRHEKIEAGIEVRVSADGRVFSCWKPNWSPSGLRTIEVAGGTATVHDRHESVGYIIPNSQGDTIYTHRRRFFTNLEPRDEIQHALPAVNGEFGLLVRGGGRLSCFHEETPGRLVELPEEMAARPPDSFDYARLAFDQMQFLVPYFQRLVVVAPTRQQLRLWRFDAERLYRDAGQSFLWVLSEPPRIAVAGSKWQYPIQAASSTGNVNFQLEIAPDDMTLSAEGVLQWNVPPRVNKTDPTVLVTLSDENRRTAYHKFTLTVVSPDGERVRSHARR